ncbi:Sec63-domain-containing protein [Corynespora cassiicola Philippines]|uniref:Sec63-domain-containing protein n=1 Tax=Corynespora cassiicola Philippines TaxID=1448308 RepID=A0A2T2NDI2_CORCC|nr:Sec63-domain-containing protein [Corynespora cassiicola Philippines]
MGDRKGGGGGADHLKQFKYSEMSNLVLQADRRFMHRRQEEHTGDPESLAGRIKIGEMGGRVARDTAPVQPKKTKLGVERANITEGGDVLEREQRKRKRDGAFSSATTDADLLVEGLTYKPRSQESRQTLELITTIVSNHLGDVPVAVTRSAADQILEYLKDDNMKDFDKKRETDELLGVTMGAKEFNELVNLGKKITDYDAQDEDENMDEELGTAEDAENADQGVAVVFNEEDDEDNGEPAFEIQDRDSSDDEDEAEEMDVEDAGNQDANEDSNRGITDAEETIIQDQAAVDDQADESKTLIPVHEIDAYWLARKIGQVYSDAHTQQEKTQEAFDILTGLNENGEERPFNEIENDIMALFDFAENDLAEILLHNRDKIVWVTKWRRAAENQSERAAIEREMKATGRQHILRELHSRETGVKAEPSGPKIKMDLMNIDLKSGPADTEMQDAPAADGIVGGLKPSERLVNLDNIVFDQGNHLMTNPNVKLPQGSTRRQFKGYEEIHVPPPKAKRDPNEPRNKPTSELPDWARVGFGKSTELNRIQTRCYPTAFEDDGNMLICAPTGSGKTNVAMLTMLREIGKHRNPETGEIALDNFKIIYIAPLKALVQEQVGNFGKRLEPFGIRVAELTGDRQLTKQQIAETQIIVTTPEKYDVITRKATDLSYINLVRLICIDEIHLLHDDRGPVIESIVSRTIRRTEQTGDHVRIVGLSATLPNYRDVASFLRVDPEKGLFHFDGTFRPCPLKQEYIGVTDKKAIKQLKTMNDVCYTKVMEQVGEKGNQMLIFVHSRKETAKTAKYIRDKALEMETIGKILRMDAASREILREESSNAQNSDLKDLMPYGFGIHHAGMSRADRTNVEDLFGAGELKVLVCTATLAWGVNLPAHTVIIKGTQVYSPEKGSWVELSPQDVLQMLGRAGRPQFDTYGEGIIITTQAEIQYYLSLLNQQLPIESQFISRLADNLNAEVVLGNVRNRDEGVDWLGYTYLYVRMLRSPALYRIGPEYENDTVLEQRRVDLIHAAAHVLEKGGLIKYDKRSGQLQPTELGRIASHYYITHNSMRTYNQQLQSGISAIDLFRVFSESEEFKYIPVRQDEKLELGKMLTRVPIPVKEAVEDPHAKINVLLQAYISRLKLEGLALMADLVYVTQSAGRILRAIFEICLKKGWSQVAKLALDMCKMAEKRMWPTMSPLRQFPNCPKEIVQKAERIDVRWSSYFGLDPPSMGELLGMPKAGRTVCQLVQKFPRLELEATPRPLTRSMLRIELTIRPDFVWDDQYHGASEAFWVLVEDCDGEEILFHDTFILRKDYAEGELSEHFMELTVPIDEPMPPNYFVTVLSDRWMASETKLAVSFQKLIMPAKFPAHTPILDLQPLPPSAVKRKDYANLYGDIGRFNKVQTQVFNSLYGSDDSVFLGASAGIGKTFCGEFAILRHWSTGKEGRIVYIAPFQELVDNQYKNWSARLSGIGGGKDIVKLTGETTADLRLLEKGDLILATPAQWDTISRSWQRRKNVQTVALLIADDLHMLGGAGGHIYEIVVSRMQAMAAQLESGLRIVGLSVSLSNARDIGEWIGASKHTIFNFSPGVRAVPLELKIQSFTIPHFPSLMLAMAKPTYKAITQLAPNQPALVFVPSRKQARASAFDLLAAALADDDEDRFLNASLEEIQPILEKINEDNLRSSLEHGIGYFHEALSAFDKKAVQHLFKLGAIQVVVASRNSCWEIEANAHLVVVMNTQFFDGQQHRYVDYPISEILQMFGRAGRVGEDKSAKGVLMLPAVKREYYKKFLNEALPIESSLHDFLHDAFVAEISAKTIESTQEAVDWTTYTYFYRRLLANPSYYNLHSTSHEGLSAHLSDLVEQTVKELVEANMIEHDEEEDTIMPLNPCMIAAYYSISFITMQTLMMSLKGNTSLKGILEIITAATEFEDIQIRRHEERILSQIYDRVPNKMAEVNFETPHFKAFVLLQAHFSRMQLPVDLAKDQELVLKKVLNILSASVDVLSSEAHLNAIKAMEISQMVVQAMWQYDSPLKQIPHMEGDRIKVARKFGIEDIDAFIDAMDEDENPNYEKLMKALEFGQRELSEAATFVNEYYPNVELSHEIVDADEITTNSPIRIKVNVTRNLDEEDQPKTEVHAPFFPATKSENFWIIVGNPKENSLLAIKKVTIGRQVQTALDFTVEQPGEHDLTLYLVSDSYLGADQGEDFKIVAAEGMDEDDEDEDEE